MLRMRLSVPVNEQLLAMLQTGLRRATGGPPFWDRAPIGGYHPLAGLRITRLEKRISAVRSTRVIRFSHAGTRPDARRPVRSRNRAARTRPRLRIRRRLVPDGGGDTVRRRDGPIETWPRARRRG